VIQARIISIRHRSDGFFTVSFRLAEMQYIRLQQSSKQMSTLLIDVDLEQEKVLETLLTYMEISCQKLPSPAWDDLPDTTRERVDKGLADAEKERYSPAKTVLDYLNAL